IHRQAISELTEERLDDRRRRADGKHQARGFRRRETTSFHQKRHQRGYDPLAKVDQKMAYRQQGDRPPVHQRLLGLCHYGYGSVNIFAMMDYRWILFKVNIAL